MLKSWKVGDNYEILKQIGVGSYGSVVKAKNKKSGNFVAIKKIGQLFVDLIDCKRVLREITLLKRINHPNIVKLLDIIISPGEEDSFEEIYLVFEYATGDLKKLFKS